MYEYDIVVKNGLVVDPSQGINEIMDVAIAEGVIVDLCKGINAANQDTLLMPLE